MSIRTYTQEDPIGLAGGLNLYGFAGGDPINFSDPFGLCRKDNEVCHDLVRRLKAVGKPAFTDAAKVYQGTNRWVHMVAGDDSRLGVTAENRDGDPATFNGGNTTVSDVFLNQEMGEGDQLITAVHEAREHMPYATPLPIHPNGFGGDHQSYMQLPEQYRGSAKQWALFLFSKKGLSIPGLNWGNYYQIAATVTERTNP